MDPVATWLLIGLVSAASGFVSTTAGGSGVVLLPALLLVLPDPLAAIAVSKLAIYAGSFPVATLRFSRAGLLAPRRYLGVALTYGVGTTVGVLLLRELSGPVLFAATLAAVVAAAALVAVRERVRTWAARNVLPKGAAWLLAFGIGVYSGGFPGSGLLIIALLLLAFGVDQRAAVANKAYVQLIGALPSALLLVASVVVPWALVAAAIVGEAIGSWVGARWATDVDPRWLTRAYYVALVVVAVVAAGRLLAEVL